MKLTKVLFTAIINNNNPALITALDRSTCGCGYCYQWVYQMSLGKFNPMKNEMDMELKDVKTAEELYRFVKSKTDDIQGNEQTQK